LLQFRDANRIINVTAELANVQAETLVTHTVERPQLLEYAREIASRISHAHLVTGHGLPNGPDATIQEQILRFLGADPAVTLTPPQPSPPRVATASGVRTVLFTDLVGHTEMMRRLGDTAGRELLRQHERLTRDAIAHHGGTEIKTDGDSFMVSFGSVAAAMECAVSMQRAIAQRNDGAAEPLRVRMGLNAGEPIEENGDLFGESVILASRIAAQADEGEILIAEPVRHLLAGKAFVFADRGTFVPKGFEDAVRLFEVRWRE
jgi:class 3 adenylate cyclase